MLEVNSLSRRLFSPNFHFLTSHPVMCGSELRVLVGDHEGFRDKVEVFGSLGNLESLDIFVHPGSSNGLLETSKENMRDLSFRVSS